jgi:hypothetical protein
MDNQALLHALDTMPIGLVWVRAQRVNWLSRRLRERPTCWPTPPCASSAPIWQP